MNPIEKDKLSGLLLRADTGFSVKLYPDYQGDAEVPVTQTWKEDGKTCYYYENFRGRCRYKISGEGCYTIIQNLFVPETPALMTWDVTTQKMVGGGFEPETVKLYSPGILEAAVPSNRAMWPDYQEVYNAPFFRNGKDGHQCTTQEEMEAYLSETQKKSANMYIYTLGHSPKYHYRMPVVLFTKTDLTGAETLEEAAARIKANGKLNVHYQGHIHGNEPAGGEATLAIIGMLAGPWGDGLLENMNIYVIPRMNPDGARDFTRKNASGVDTNRDMLAAQFVEVQLQHKLLRLFEPEVGLDSHEYTTNPERNPDSFRDIMTSSGWDADCSKAFQDLSEEITRVSFAPLFAQGMQPSYYIHYTNSRTPLMATRYMSLRRAISILLESRGINSGTMVFERRVTAHVISVKAILEHVQKNCDRIQMLIRQERENIAAAGKHYDEDRLVVLKTEEALKPELAAKLTRYDTGPGTVIGVINKEPKAYCQQVRSRPMPTAYVIPAGESWTDKVLQILDHHGIPAQKLAEGTTLWLQQYTGTIQEAQLTEEKQVNFPNGAYFCPMDHALAFVLAALMEPDMNDAYMEVDGAVFGTLAQAGYIPAAEGIFPIYRYIRDLPICE